MAASLNNLGAIAFSRGDLEAATAYYKDAVEAWKETAPDSLDLALGLSNLGNALLYRGEFDLARSYYEESLALRRKKAPHSLDTAGTLNNLGSLFQYQGKPEIAERYHQEALAIDERLAPHSLNMARSLANLSTLASRRGDLVRAKDLVSQALSISVELAPTSPDTASMFTSLGLISRLAGDTQRAIKLTERALDLMNGLSLDTEEVARARYELGKALLHDNPTEASDQFEQAIAILERQIAKRAGLQDVRATFEAQHEGLYRDYVELLIQLGRPEDAFLVLERYRAKRLLTLLAERDLVISDEIPQELEETRRSVETRYDNLQRRMIAASNGKPSPDLAELAIEIRKTRIEHEAIVSKIKKASPRFASIQYPQALDLSATRECLDEGTVLLTYGIGNDDIHVFATSRNEPLLVRTVKLSEAEARERVAELRTLVEESRSLTRIGRGRRELLRQRAKSLYDLIIAPVEAVIARHKRILIVSDGPLHALPWGVLVREEKDASATKLQYLTEWKPFHVATSATVFSEIEKERSRLSAPVVVGNRTPALAAFGDPRFSQSPTKGDLASIGESRVRGAVERGFGFLPLPDSRIEVEKIGSLYGDGAKTFLGYAASEENVKSLPRNTRIVHFATHAILDERFPLNSAVVLSIPEKFEEGKENGLLQAWEIFEQVRLDADLVVLSACESGLGKEMGGEGLIGLTRAFQYAGARSVMASLWKISDHTTAELMVRFYKHLKDGLPKDEALRAAQMELIRGPIQVKNEKGEVEEIDASAPYYWAAFQIYGDWQ
jgi:CHAT domain-containing protein/Tfp pilus assembly protein PilF